MFRSRKKNVSIVSIDLYLDLTIDNRKYNSGLKKYTSEVRTRVDKVDLLSPENKKVNCYFNFDNVKTTARRVSRAHTFFVLCPGINFLILLFAQIYIFDLSLRSSACFMKIKLILMKAEMKFSLSSLRRIRIKAQNVNLH